MHAFIFITRRTPALSSLVDSHRIIYCTSVLERAASQTYVPSFLVRGAVTVRVSVRALTGVGGQGTLAVYYCRLQWCVVAHGVTDVCAVYGL